jgi:membrane associated rhomboid family serine protease
MITIVIIVVTCVVSYISFSNTVLMDDLIFYPPAISKQKQWYRFITCGFIHADLTHLAFNMYSFYIFGRAIERIFDEIYGNYGRFFYLLLYFTALVACLLPTYFKNKYNSSYRSLGASGAVSAIIFAFIFIAPLQGISLIFIPIPAPAFIFGFIYLGITYYLTRRGNSYINHSAHFWGAIYGIAFLIVTSLLYSDYNALANFIYQVKGYLQSKF